MQVNCVLITTKETTLDLFRKNHEDLNEVASKQDIENMKKEHENHNASLNTIKSVLDKLKIKYQVVSIAYAHFDEFKNKDLIISVGGDGTALHTAHYILDNTPLLAIRSERKSVGALCSINTDEFDEKLKEIINDKHKTESWTRIEAKIGNKIDLALNDVFVGVKYNHAVAKYEVEFNGLKEKQIGSGLVVSTGAGSTGWYKNIPGNDGVFPRTSKELKFITRELEGETKLMKATMKKEDVLEITSLMDIDGILSYDGNTGKRMHAFSRGKKATIRISDKPLTVII